MSRPCSDFKGEEEEKEEEEQFPVYYIESSRGSSEVNGFDMCTEMCTVSRERAACLLLPVFHRAHPPLPFVTGDNLAKVLDDDCSWPDLHGAICYIRTRTY